MANGTYDNLEVKHTLHVGSNGPTSTNKVGIELDKSEYIRSTSTMQSGRVKIKPVANTPTYVQVKFRVPFLATPRVVCTPATSVPGTQVQEVGHTDVNKDGFKLYLTRTNTTETSVDWIAVFADE